MGNYNPVFQGFFAVSYSQNNATGYFNHDNKEAEVACRNLY